MQFERKTEEEQRAFYEGSLELAERAIAEAGAISQVYELAGVRVRFVFAGERLIPVLTPALAHLRGDDEGEVDATFLIWDTESTGVEMLRPPCKWDNFTDRGDIWGFDSERIRTAFHWIECSLHLFDRETRRGMFWVESAAQLPFWVLASPLRTLWHWLMELHGAQLLHAAAVGTENGAVVVTGRGGVGKSTTALACLTAGLDYLADDYLVVRPEPEPRVYCLYNTAKLNPDQVERFPGLAHLARNLDRVEREKAVFYLHPEKSELLALERPIRAVLTPRIWDSEETRFAPASKLALRRAAAFTTMSQLPYVGHHTHERIDGFVRALPGFEILLGRDLERLPVAISEFLREGPERVEAACQPEFETDAPATLVSVVIPVYNGERFLREAIENILGQDYPALEIIVVDDGSTDGTARIVESLPVDVRYFKQPNGGPASARNRGIRDTSGEFIAFLDVDDLWPEGNLDRLVAELTAHPELEVVHGHAQRLELDAETGEYAYVGNPQESFGAYLGAGLYRRTAFEKVGLFDPEMRFGEDIDWYNRAEELEVGLRRIDEVTLFVRRHKGNMTEGKSLVELHALRAFKKALDRKRGVATRVG